MRIALYQPDIAGNVGTILRLAACLGVPVDLIEPCGFAFSRPGAERAGMDYAGDRRGRSGMPTGTAFEAAARGGIVLLTTRGDVRLRDARFRADDMLLLGSRARGVPPAVHDAADAARAYPACGLASAP